MFEQLRLAWQERKLRRIYRPLFDKAKTQDERARLAAQSEVDYDQIDEERRTLTQRRLLRKAKRLLIPRPAFNEANWGRPSIYTGRHLLTEEAVYALLTEIYKVKKQRQELRVGRLPILTAITGLVGTATGLVAALAPILPRLLGH